MQTILYEKPFPIRASADLSQWQNHMHRRIQDWYEATPRHEGFRPREQRILENFELTFHRALFFLYHPSLNIPEPPEASIISMTDAAVKMIELYRQFFRDHRLTIYWQAVENLSSAGNALMFSYVSSPRVQERLSLRSLESLINTCSSVLWGMVEHFPDFKGKRDAFDLTASKVLADLQSIGTMQASARSNDEYIDFAPDARYSPLSSPSRIGLSDHPLGGLTAQHQTTNLEPDVSYTTPRMEFSLSDFNDIAFDWEAFQNTNEYLLPTWT